MTNFNIVRTLENGTKKFDLEEVAPNSLSDAERILENGHYTNFIYAPSVYNERPENAWEGVYEVEVDSEESYQRFANMLIESPVVLTGFPDFQEWKNNKITTVDGREMKLGKWLKKMGAPAELVDFYSAQIRTGKKTWYLVISGNAQHIAGMTAYSNGAYSSCQDPDSYESRHLAGSLHDDKLFVAMLVDSLDDASDMDSACHARTVLRHVEYMGVEQLVPDRYYGSNDTKKALDECLKALQELHIHSEASRAYTDKQAVAIELKTPVNGSACITMHDEVMVVVQEEYEVEAECPHCEGSGKMEVWSDAMDNECEIDCIVCGGYGTKTFYDSIDLEEYVEIEVESSLKPYTDYYEHTGYYTHIMVQLDYMLSHIIRFGENAENVASALTFQESLNI